MYTQENKVLKCLLVGGNKVFEQEDKEIASQSLDELSSLAYTLGLSVKGSILLNLRKINPSIFYGKGQIDSLCRKADLLGCKYIVFNDEITAAQFKNIQKQCEKKVIFDRTGIILEIFKNNAKTKESKFQVELASLQYMLPRLTRKWTHLERQMGGTGTRGGPGEKQIEIDRRLIGVRITKLKNELAKIKQIRQVQSNSRKKTFRVSLVGYTNAGKSSLLNSLSGPGTTYVENKLFATLDTTTRRIQSGKGQEFLLTDTVGLIQNLPHDLVASFRSTFEEVKNSDLIIVVVDSSSPRKVISEHISTINTTLDSMNIDLKESLLVFNKVDSLVGFEKISYLRKSFPDSVFVSAKEFIKIDELLDSIRLKAGKNNQVRNINISYSKSFLISDIYERFIVKERKDNFEFIEMRLEGSVVELDRLERLLSND